MRSEAPDPGHRSRARGRLDFPYFRGRFVRATGWLALAVLLPTAAGALGAGPPAVVACFLAGVTVAAAVAAGLVARMEEDRRRARMLESQLRQTSLAASTLPLARSVLEELRGSLAGIAVSARTAGEAGADAAASLENLARIEESARGCRALVDRYRAALAATGTEGALEKVDVNAVVEDLAELLRFETYHRRIEVERRLAADLPRVRGGYGRVRQVVLAVLLNALDAVGEDGTVIVETGGAEDYVVVTVVDSGPGLPENPERVFDPLYTTRSDGVGLGLTLGRSIVGRMGGSISAANEPGLGARVTIRFPAPAADSDR